MCAGPDGSRAVPLHRYCLERGIVGILGRGKVFVHDSTVARSQRLSTSTHGRLTFRGGLEVVDGQRVCPAAALLERRGYQAIDGGLWRLEDETRVRVHARIDVVVLGQLFAGGIFEDEEGIEGGTFQDDDVRPSRGHLERVNAALLLVRQGPFQARLAESALRLLEHQGGIGPEFVPGLSFLGRQCVQRPGFAQSGQGGISLPVRQPLGRQEHCLGFSLFDLLTIPVEIGLEPVARLRAVAGFLFTRELGGLVSLPGAGQGCGAGGGVTVLLGHVLGEPGIRLERLVEDPAFTWERTDKAEALRREVGVAAM
jgi:hypothetical protein